MEDFAHIVVEDPLRVVVNFLLEFMSGSQPRVASFQPDTPPFFRQLSLPLSIDHARALISHALPELTQPFEHTCTHTRARAHTHTLSLSTDRWRSISTTSSDELSDMGM